VQVQLGTAYAVGDGVTPDGAEAVRWLRKAADQGDASGESYLGEIYVFSQVFPRMTLNVTLFLAPSSTVTFSPFSSYSFITAGCCTSM
jgi:hypothetical protein